MENTVYCLFLVEGEPFGATYESLVSVHKSKEKALEASEKLQGDHPSDEGYTYDAIVRKMELLD